MKKLAKILIVLFIIAVSIFAGFNILSAPEEKSKEAPDNEFSAERAMEIVEVIGREPHPMGSKENIEVRDYIISELKSLEVQPEIQSTYVKNRFEKLHSETEGKVDNIIARIEGTGHGKKALMLCAHYDSTPYGPGAADDASGVAAIIETLRALKGDKPFKNDIIILISDGEEMTMLGAAGFAKEHPYINDVGFIINLETRGNKGASLMFETGTGNSRYIEEYKKAVSNPVAFSILNDIYRWMPNATDFSIFKDMDIDGMNFAFIDGAETYHEETDTPENLSRRSLQHTGENLLSLTRHFGNIDLDNINDTTLNSVYFNVFKGQLISYSNNWIPLLTLIGIALFLGVILIGIRKKHVSLKGIIIGMLFSILSIAILVIVSFGIWTVIKNLVFNAGTLNEYQYYKQIIVPQISNIFMIAFIVFASGIIVLFARLFCKWFKDFDLILGSMGLWAVLMIAASFMAKGFSYLFAWTLIFASISIGSIFLIEKKELKNIKHIAGFFIITFTTGIIYVPIIYLFLRGLSIDAVFIHVGVFSIPAAVIVPYAGSILTEEGVSIKAYEKISAGDGIG